MKRDPIHMQQDMLKTLITKDQLEATVARLGREITEDYRGRTPMLVAVLKGRPGPADRHPLHAGFYGRLQLRSRHGFLRSGENY